MARREKKVVPWTVHDECEPRSVHYGCHEFRDDAELVIGGRAHESLTECYRAHLAYCVDCQRYHHQLEAIYERPCKVAPLDSFARDREFAAILERTGSSCERASTRLGAPLGVGLLSAVAAVLALALMIPSLGAALFGPPAAARLELHSDGATPSFDNVRIPDSRHPGHFAQSFGRVIGGDASLTDVEGRPTTGDSLTVGTDIETDDKPVQVALLGRMIASFQPRTSASWTSASAGLIELGLVSGTLAVRYDRRPGDPILHVRTPTAIVRVVGTVFTVAVDERGDTTVSVLRGKVEVLRPNGRQLAEVEAGFRFDARDSSYRDVGRREVAAALPVSEHHDLSARGGLGEGHEPGQVPRSWTVPGLSDDPSQRTLDRVLDPEGDTSVIATATARGRGARPASRPRDNGEAATRELIERYARSERNHVAAQLERCRTLKAEPETRFRAARCLGDFMRDYGSEPEAVEGLLLLGALRMDFAHDYQSATRNFEEFLRRAPDHPKAELARYRIVLAAIEGGYIDRGRETARVYLHHYPDGQYVGRILQRFPELKSEI